MRVRLRDVAERAGVSVKTVSNVVNGYQHVSPQMRARVQAVLDETGYRPNATARSLRAGRTGVIALAVPEIGNPYFAELAGFVVQEAEERGWIVLIDQTDGRLERERVVADGLRHHLIDGLILSPVALGVDDLAGRGPEDVALVLIGEKLDAGPADHVAIDNVAAARAATEHLLALGRTRIAAIGHQPSSAGSRGSPACASAAGRRRCATRPWSPSRGCSARSRRSAASTAWLRWATSSTAGLGPTRCSASTTPWRSGPCASWPTAGCESRRTSRWSASTTWPTVASPYPRCPPSPRTRRASPATPCGCWPSGSSRGARARGARRARELRARAPGVDPGSGLSRLGRHRSVETRTSSNRAT